MKEIIEKALSQQNIGGLPKEALEYTLSRASLKKETGALCIDMTLNFVMPLTVCSRIKDEIAKALDYKIKTVEINFSYENLIMETKEAITLFLPHMISIVNGEYSSLTKSIQTDGIEWDGRNLTVYVLGGFATTNLNADVKKKFEMLLKQHLDIDAHVTFKNNEELYDQKAKAFKENEEQDIKASLKEYAESLQQKAAASPASSAPAEDNSFAPRGEWKSRKKEKSFPLPATG